MRKALRGMRREILTQDNLATNIPIYMAQREVVFLVEDGEGNCNTRLWVWDEDASVTLTEDEFKLDKDASSAEFTAYGVISYWENMQPFFTRKAAQHYLDSQAYKWKLTRVYVESGYRNYEFHILREYLSLPWWRRLLPF